jgi:hypothetical protein
MDQVLAADDLRAQPIENDEPQPDNCMLIKAVSLFTPNTSGLGDMIDTDALLGSKTSNAESSLDDGSKDCDCGGGDDCGYQFTPPIMNVGPRMSQEIRK